MIQVKPSRGSKVNAEDLSWIKSPSAPAEAEVYDSGGRRLKQANVLELPAQKKYLASACQTRRSGKPP